VTDWKRETILDDGSEVWVGPTFGIIVPPGWDAAAEIRRLQSRLRAKRREPGPYSGT
jgi:hypothetical protein